MKLRSALRFTFGGVCMLLSCFTGEAKRAGSMCGSGGKHAEVKAEVWTRPPRARPLECFVFLFLGRGLGFGLDGLGGGMSSLGASPDVWARAVHLLGG